MDDQARKDPATKQETDLKNFTDAQKANPKGSDAEDLKAFKETQTHATA